jgi:hypothetical protein
MGIRIFIAAAALVALTGLAPLAAHAAAACPDGDIAKLRMSKVPPTGSMAGLAKAVADHQKWYRDHGYPDRIVLAPVLILDRASGRMVASPDQAMTLHLASHEVPGAKRDAAWDAYVAEYKANSQVTSETIICYPQH